MKKFINRYRIWKLWSKESNEGKFFKLLVLLNLAECISFETFRFRIVTRERLDAMNEFVQKFTRTNQELNEDKKKEE